MVDLAYIHIHCFWQEHRRPTIPILPNTVLVKSHAAIDHYCKIPMKGMALVLLEERTPRLARTKTSMDLGHISMCFVCVYV